jgi:ubiquinone/menaquinone biosynthesis C-methylase UbiE
MAFDICPWWLGYLLISPVRRWRQDPHRILVPYIRDGMTVLEPGPGMGFLTLELARLVGPNGKVVAVDIQPKMLRTLGRRAAKAGLASRVDLRLPKADGLNADDLSGKIDFVLAFAVVHEFPDAGKFFAETYGALRPGGDLLLSEPTGHVRPDAWARTLEIASAAGFTKTAEPAIRSMRSALLHKKT